MDDDAALGAELAAMLAGARRRAVRDGDRQIDTAHLLHSLLEHDPQCRAAVGGPQRLARLFGYLVQRSIGYGLRWQSSVEDSGAIAVVPAPAGPAVRDARDAPGWSPAAAAAMAAAREHARRRGGSRVAGTDLLAALTEDPGSRAVEVLERAGIPARDLNTRILDARLETGTEEYAGDSGASC
ncbi:Clp protease N-terminal domain-containing protein [Streptomyces sp. FXJ1.172]|uniref:Clp protease N-terminal domain-containing protein n=1 Tax=Streptomyces sp. FXJ1.172 TaxID=710705 RepID=UPI000AEA6027|nr:Clp protease N-terminal domain-containing protein [Streptomyces sp. FXJ1.172]WEO98705.1 Clp protease N-terminal domain-containing protein [Streptomyces sp. FXJ1.172]